MLDDTPETPDWWLLRLGRQLRERHKKLDVWWDWYRGDHPLPHVPAKAEHAFREFQRRARTNFLGTIASAPVHRMSVLGVTDGAGEEDREAWRWWQQNKLDSRQKLVYRTAMALGEGYVSVGSDPQDPRRPVITPEHPRQVIIEHDALGRPAAALKAWHDDIYGVGRAEVHIPGYLIRYRTPDDRPCGGRLPWGPDSWVQDGEPQKAGDIPIVSFPCLPELGEEPEPLFARVIDIQDRINLGVLNRMTAERYSAFRQKWVTGHKFATRIDPVTGLTLAENPFVPSPGAVWASEGTDVKFGESSQTDLLGYLKTHESDVRDMLVITHTPAYYFASQLINISADTVNALDINHLAFVREQLATFGEAWEDVNSLAAGVAGVERDYTESEIRWQDPRQGNPAVMADMATKLKAVGYPLPVIAERLGESPQAIRRISSGQAAEALLLPPLLPAAAAATPAPAQVVEE